MREKAKKHLVLVAVDADAHALLDVGGRDAVAEADDELGDLLDIDHGLGVVRVGVNNLGAAGHLERDRVSERDILRYVYIWRRPCWGQ